MSRLTGCGRSRPAATKSASTAATSANATRSSTGESFLARSRDATRQALDGIRAAAARQWAPERSVPTRDSQTDVRDAVHAANRAASMPEKIGALNRANAAFWNVRTRDHLEALLPRPGTQGPPLERQIRGAPRQRRQDSGLDQRGESKVLGGARLVTRWESLSF